ncbi:hypothetical protein GIB67_005176 [Kingdonia uniflora]|uniref:NB-ARC domain-containing protein n=1 Tax=Kingdonia uniflora TaxID=39325 RepID=A0A7J7NNK5_9MAGN|nr:hypothetical protein GIB67_005176 [Kingdonia uniflora]
MGGVGKTTLMKEICKQVKETKLFDKVVFATVSQDPDLKGIQTEIAENLGMKIKEEKISTRTARLSQRLKREKRILVILDDFWARLELIHVGVVPCGDGQNTCKVLITSRSLDVCCSMESTKNIEILVLSEQDSLKLFQQIVSDVDSSALQKMSEEIVSEYGGLPLAIVTLAKALRERDQGVWVEVARQLRKSNLSDTLEEARGRLHVVVEKLIGSCFLSKGSGNKDDCVVMHGIVRDVAISIAHDSIIKCGMGLAEWLKMKNIERCRMSEEALNLIATLKKLEILTLQNCGIKRLPKDLGGLTNLKLLNLSDNESLVTIPPNVISRLFSLEELYMSKSFIGWEIEEMEDDGHNASLVEVASLTSLTTLYLDFDIYDLRWLSTDIKQNNWEKLTKFCINAGSVNDINPGGYESNALKNVVELNPKGFNNLKSLTISGMREMEYLISVEEQVLETMFPHLEILQLFGVDELKTIWNGTHLERSFEKLRVLQVRGCDKIVNILPTRLWTRLQNLEEMKVCFCNNLKEVFHSVTVTKSDLSPEIFQ